MIGDMKAGKLNCIVCKTLSRAFRNYADQGYFLEEVFPRYRTRFISLGQSPGGQLFGPRGGADGAGNSHQWDSQ